MSPNAGVAGSQPMSTAVHRSPNKLWRSNSIFNLCLRPSIMLMNQEQELENHVENLLDDEFLGKEIYYIQ